MLAITRTVGQSIRIFVPGRERPIVVRVGERSGDGKKRVVLGVEADLDVKVLRSELGGWDDRQAPGGRR